MKTLAAGLSLLSGALITAVLFLWIAAGEIYDYEDTFHANKDGATVDVVLCLAGGKRRIPLAVDLWAKLKQSRPQGSSPVLFFSGVGPKAGFQTIKDQGVSHEILSMMKDDQVIFENVSGNTFENAEIFASFAKQKHWKQVVLVTAGYHMRRAHFVLRKILDPDVVIKTYTVDAVHFDRNEWHQNAYAIRVTMIEYIKWLYYRYSH